jgi:PAS domain S-box-containing protein
LTYFSPDGVIGVFWPASGWALAVLLTGGRRYAWGVFAGSLVAELMMGLPLAATVGASIGATAGALLGHWLLVRDRKFNLDLRTMGDYGSLLWKGAVPASALSAFIGVTSLTGFGILGLAEDDKNMLNWCIGDVLGILLITPLVLIWRRRPEQLTKMARWSEAVLLTGLTLLVGQVIFLGWFPDVFPALARKGFWMFPLVSWAAARLGKHGVIALLCLVSAQAMHGLHEGVAYFANEQIEARLFDGWSFLTVLSLMGMNLAMYFEESRRAETGLRIAATAFECQEGMIITDANQLILRTNQSFTRIMGYSNDEVVGKPTAFLRSDRHPPAFFEAIRSDLQRSGHWQGEIWYRRKNGEVFPQWMTLAAVRDATGGISQYVATHIDISEQKHQESKRLANEIKHRNTLVREVHHRIKNNLQGISGILSQFVAEHPETADIINQVKSQMRSIAVLHGLQGRASMDTVRLCELTSAIAEDVRSVWKTPISVDIPALWTPGVIAEKEAVPIALVLNELIVNAVKHGGKAHGYVHVSLRKGRHPEVIHVSILNAGHLRASIDRPTEHHVGLQLVDSLMPQEGARLFREQYEKEVLTRLELGPPVVHLESRSLHEPA